MIEHIWSVLCSRSVIDRDSNNISLVEVIEQLQVTGSSAGVLPISLELVTLWSRSHPERAAKGLARLAVIAPDGSKSEPAEYQVNLTSHQRLRGRARIQGLPIRGAGRYQFDVHIKVEGDEDWRKVASIPLDLSIEPLAESPTG